MSDLSFFDTNMLIYTDDHDAPEKQSRALELIEQARRTNTGFISTQVLQEYFVAATRKLGVPAARSKYSRISTLFKSMLIIFCPRLIYTVCTVFHSGTR